jgi:hypothetical protein
MTKTLIDRIREAGEFDDKPIHAEMRSRTGEKASCTEIHCASRQHAQTQWAFEALEYAINNLAHCLCENSNQECGDCGVLREIAALVPKGEK